jgi:O-methyltransferase involved in polyketide biosynthesis
LMARHQTLDHLLSRAIEDGEVQTVVEVAAGLSPRGWAFTQRFGKQLRYIEVDLPAMAEKKRGILDKLADGDSVEIVSFDVFQPGSLELLFSSFDQSQGVAVITEGMVNYYPKEKVEAFWRSVASVLSKFKHGLYLSDLKLRSSNETPHARGVMAVISALVRGRVHTHFGSIKEARSSLLAAGFGANSDVLDPRVVLPSIGAPVRPGAEMVNIVAARMG